MSSFFCSFQRMNKILKSIRQNDTTNTSWFEWKYHRDEDWCDMRHSNGGGKGTHAVEGQYAGPWRRIVLVVCTRATWQHMPSLITAIASVWCSTVCSQLPSGVLVPHMHSGAASCFVCVFLECRVEAAKSSLRVLDIYWIHVPGQWKMSCFL